MYINSDLTSVSTRRSESATSSELGEAKAGEFLQRARADETRPAATGAAQTNEEPAQAVGECEHVQPLRREAHLEVQRLGHRLCH